MQTHYTAVVCARPGVAYADDVASWRDGAIATAVFAVVILGGMLHVDDTLGAPPAAAYLLGAVASALTLARDRAPVLALVATTACGMLVAPLGLLLTPLTAAPAVVSAYTLGVRAQRRTALGVLLPCAALLVALAPVVEDDFTWADTSRLVIVAASPLVAAVLGRLTRHRRAHLAFVEERARRAEQALDSETRRRVAEERLRIARDLHDLVAHQITLANAQASVAAHLVEVQPDRARESLHELVSTTRHALDELRATVGLLRQQGDDAAPSEPAPGLDRLPELLESFRRAGLEVEVEHEGTPRPLSPAVDLTAYRIAQEALTNVTKHADARNALFRLAWRHHEVTIAIADDGVGHDPQQERPPGYGLIGMRERAAAVGGHLTAGARAEGGFLVTAHLPIPGEPDTRSTGDPARSEAR